MSASLPPAEPILRIDALECRFGAVKAVGGVSLRVAEGERHAILGANGAGKTTLFNLVTGDIRPTGGRVTAFGRDITQLPVRKRIRLGLRRTYQTSLVFGGLTVRQSLFLAVRGVTGARFSVSGLASRSTHMAEADQLAARVGLGDVCGRPAGSLSHGERRQLELGMALAGEPRLLLLDEPAAGLSPSERVLLLALLRGLPRSITLVMIEHDMDIALQSVDRVTVMHNGLVVAEGDPASIAANETVHAIYMGRHAA